MANNKKQSAVTDEQIIAALISSGTIAKAAEAAGTAPEQLQRLLSQSEALRAENILRSRLPSGTQRSRETTHTTRTGAECSPRKICGRPSEFRIFLFASMRYCILPKYRASA